MLPIDLFPEYTVDDPIAREVVAGIGIGLGIGSVISVTTILLINYYRPYNKHIPLKDALCGTFATALEGARVSLITYGVGNGVYQLASKALSNR